MRNWAAFMLRSLVRMLALLLCVSIAAFTLVTISPIDPLQVNVGQAALGGMSAEQVEKLRAYWGTERPPVQRYLAWLSDFVRGDMGVSLLYRRAVSAVLAEKLTNSLWLLTTVWVISGLLGYALGLLAGAKEGRWTDRAIRAYALCIASTPAFWIALVLLMIFAVWLGVLPIGLSVPIGTVAADVTLADRLRHAALPALTLSLTGVAGIALHTREKVIDALHSDYALFAAARGESRGSILRRHER